ncbi:MAG: nucleotide pyrophosphohydrolase [Muribaculaceae bacterium]|nr:nucleotide pyrophosphohydrolase [Muribaculaceae bacterium]
MNNSEHTLGLGEIQRIVDQWISATGAGYFSPLTNTAILAEECGEVASVMARRFGDQRAKNSDRISDSALADEMADVLWVLCALANQTGISLEEAFRNNLYKKNVRDNSRFL